MSLRRRTFLKTAALIAAGAALPACKPQVRKLVPYVLPDDEIVPGIADWYASTCGECGAGCGVLVRTMEGRAKKLEGNPDHPVNRGKLCAKGQAALQALYHPDRLKTPLRREGPVATGQFHPISWEDAVQQVVQELRNRESRVIMISRPVSGTLAALMAEFMSAVDGNLYWYDPGAELPLRAAIRLSFNVDTLPQYDLAEADLLMSFGAPFLEHWLSPVSDGVAFGQMRQGRPAVRGRFIHIEPRLSLTAANADRWIPIRPGGEGLLAAGIGRVILDEQPDRVAADVPMSVKRFFQAAPMERIERETDIAREVIVRLARELASSRHPLAIGGGPACAHTNATQSLMAVNGLNVLLGNVGRPGGLRFFEPTPFVGSSVRYMPWLTERKVIDLVEAMDERERTVVLLNDCNPLFTMPPSVPIASLLSRASFLVKFGSWLDESALMADLVCPDHSWLESWGDQVPRVGLPVHAVGLRQPAVRPLYETRQTGDVILDIARAVDPARFGWESFLTLLEEHWRNEPGTVSAEAFESAWLQDLQRGGRWGAQATPVHVTYRPPLRTYEPAKFSGDESEFPLVFYPYPSMTLGYDGAHLPWLQELPDTLTAAMWGSWAEINPVTAKTYGIAQGDVVRITSPAGSIEVPALLYPAIRPDVVAVPIGQGHAAYGRYAKERGVNPLVLIAPAFDQESGAVASGATRVRIEPTGRKGRIVLLEQPAVEASSLIQVDRVKPT